MKRRHIAIIILSMCLLALACIFFIVPCQKQLKILRQNADMLSSQIKIARLRVMQQGVAAEKNTLLNNSNVNLLADLSMLAQLSGLQVDLVVQMAEKNKIHFNLFGDYRNIAKFIEALSRQQHRLYISDFTVKSLRHAELQLQMDVVMVSTFTNLSLGTAPSAFVSQQIFCDVDKTSNSPVDTQSDYPVQQLKMVGYMNILGSPSAFLELPDGIEHQASVGSVWGVELAEVIEITSNHLKLRDAQGKIYLLHIQENG